jgi:GT2 family glycosyltransferase
MRATTVIIPNHCGAQLLEQYLPSVCSHLADLGEVIVVDDASTDGSVEMLRKKFPEVRVIARETNGGFSAAVNDGIRATKGEFVVLLNNDVKVTPGFLDPIMPLFADESVFAASPRIRLPSKGGIDEGAKTGSWRHGMLYTDQRQGVTDVVPVLYPNGCAAVCRRSMLEELDGFDEAYSPFYWEDADLGYRAWKRGWKSLYSPHALVYHQHSASTSKLDAKRTDMIKARNSLLFIWRNIEDERLLRAHRRWLPLVLARRAAAGDSAFIKGWREALRLSSECSQTRERDSRHRILSDRDIFRAVGVTTV